jgi:hypothetical protein
MGLDAIQRVVEKHGVKKPGDKGAEGEHALKLN